jgi:CRP-like cAMP-binding protein
LSEFALVTNLAVPEVAEIERSAFLRVFHNREWIYSSGDAPDAVFFLASGRVKVSRLSAHGKELILDILGAGQLFGVTGVLHSEPRETLTESLGRVAVWVIRANPFRALLTKTPNLALNLVHLTARRQRLLERRLVGVAYKKAPQRLADLLLQLGETHGIRDARGILLPMKIPQSVLGSFIGMSRETVNLTLSELKRSGLIVLTGGRIIIPDPDALAALVAPTLKSSFRQGKRA